MRGEGCRSLSKLCQEGVSGSWKELLLNNGAKKTATINLENKLLPQGWKRLPKKQKIIKPTQPFVILAFSGEKIPPLHSNNLVMPIDLRGHQIVSKSTSLPELFNLPFVESQCKSKSQIIAIREMIEKRDLVCK